jgi:hypothetical protein
MRIRAALRPGRRNATDRAQHMVGKEHFRAMVGFITNDWAPFEPITGCDHRGGRCRGLRLTSP